MDITLGLKVALLAAALGVAAIAHLVYKGQSNKIESIAEEVAEKESESLLKK